MIRLESGEYAPKTGTYDVVDEHGTRQYTVDMQKGEKMPPTQSSRYHYEYNE